MVENLEQQRRDTAEILDLLLRRLSLRQWIQVRRVGVVPPQVLLRHRLGVVRQRAVVAARGPVIRQARRQHQCLVAQGVREFATVNLKDFAGVGFRRVFNPLS